MLRCKEVVKIVSSSNDDIPWSKRMELKLHLMMCKHCSRYAAHLQMLSLAFSKLIRRKAAVDRAKIRQLEDDAIKRVK